MGRERKEGRKGGKIERKRKGGKMERERNSEGGGGR